MTPLSEERGSALLAAIGSLLVMTLLAGLALKAATAASDGSVQDARRQQALQAAESGLQTAAYRLNMLQPSADRCVSSVVEAAVAGTCAPSTPEALGNGATFSYRTTPALSTADPCAGLPVRAQTALAQRCITATGTVDGVMRRLQARVAAYASTPVFPVPGLIGLQYVTLDGNVDIRDSVVATNGPLTAKGNVRTGGTVFGYLGKDVVDDREVLRGNVSVTPIGRRTEAEGPIVLAPVSTGNSATVNENVRIVNGLNAARPAPSDAISGTGITYNAATRALRATGNATLTLGGGTYNFCSISVAGNFELRIATGAKVSLYVDSPDNPNSGCPAGSGDLSVVGNVLSGTPEIRSLSGATITPGSDPTALQIYVYGRNDGQGTLTFAGNSALQASIYAPKSAITILGNARIVGGVAGASVTMKGNGFQWDARSGALQAGSSGLYYRTAWRECPVRTGATAVGC